MAVDGRVKHQTDLYFNMIVSIGNQRGFRKLSFRTSQGKRKCNVITDRKILKRNELVILRVCLDSQDQDEKIRKKKKKKKKDRRRKKNCKEQT